MNDDSQPTSPRRRMQELLAIPERLRTDEQWDELNELEISLTPVNREGGAQDRGPKRNNAPPKNDRPRPGPNAPSDRPRQNAGTPGKKPFKRTHRRPPKNTES